MGHPGFGWAGRVRSGPPLREYDKGWWLLLVGEEAEVDGVGHGFVAAVVGVEVVA